MLFLCKITKSNICQNKDNPGQNILEQSLIFCYFLFFAPSPLHQCWATVSCSLQAKNINIVTGRGGEPLKHGNLAFVPNILSEIVWRTNLVGKVEKVKIQIFFGHLYYQIVSKNMPVILALLCHMVLVPFLKN